MDIENNIIELIRRTSTHIRKCNNIFSGHNSFVNPITINYKSPPCYNSNTIGYKIQKCIEEDLLIESGKEILIVSLELPCCGVWVITYRLEMNLSLGFSCLRSSKIIVNTNNMSSENQIIKNYNNIIIQNQLLSTNTDVCIYNADSSCNINLFIDFIFGRTNNIGIFTILKNDMLPNLTATRIA